MSERVCLVHILCVSDSRYNIPITTSITHLGVYITKKTATSYREQRQQKEQKRYSSMMPAIIAKSCNRILIRKTYWKSAALPAILHGTEAIYLSNTYLANLQKEKNKALRYIVNVKRKTAIRDMKSKIFFLKHILQHNSLLKEIFLHEFEEKKPSKWIKQVKKYRLDLQLTLHTIEYSKPQYI